MNLNNPKTLDEAIEIIKELCPEYEETNTRKAEAMVLCAVKDEELVDKHKFCDFILDRMTSMIDPMSVESESLPQGTYYRRWIELWNEIESRLQAPTCLNFDRDAFQSTIREELEKQEKLLRGGPDYDTSYRYGIKSGLNFAWRIVEDNIRKAEEKSLEKNEGKRKKSFEKVEG